MKKLSLTIFVILIMANLYAQKKKIEEEPPQKDTLRVAYYVSPPFVEHQNDKVSGISFWLWSRIAEELQQPYELVEMPLNKVITGLEKGEVDMTINPLTITSERGLIIDFSAPYFISNSGLLVKSVSTLNKWASFVLSFFSINFLRAVLALFFILLIFGALVWFFERKANTEEFQPGLKGLWSGIWWSAVTMTTVGYGDKSPKTFGGRIIGLVWMFAAIIMISGFTASIASSLTVNQLDWNRSKIDDYKEDKIATVSSSATERFLKRRFFKNIKSFNSLKECVAALNKEQISYIAYDYPQITYIAMRDTSEQFELSPVKYNSQLYAFGFSELLDENIKEHITNELLKFVESTDYKILLTEYGLIED